MICSDCLQPLAAPSAKPVPGAGFPAEAPPPAAPWPRCLRCGQPRAFVEVGAVPYTLRQRLRLLEQPLLFSAFALMMGVMLMTGLSGTFGLFSITAIILIGLLMLCAILAGLTGGEALADFKLGGAKVRLARLEQLTSGRRRERDLMRYGAQFESLPALEISFTVYRRLREGDRYWVTYSPNTQTCWDIRPEAEPALSSGPPAAAR